MKHFLLFAFFPCVALAQNLLPLQVPVGTNYRVPFKVNKAWIQDRDLLQASEKNGVLFLQPQKKGETVLRLDDSTYTFQGISSEALKFYNSFHKKTPWIGIESQFRGGELTFTGRLHLYSFYKDMVVRAKNHRSTFVADVEMDDELKQKIYSEILTTLKASNLPDPGINAQDPFQLTLNPAYPNAQNYEHVLGTIGVRVKVNRMSLNSNPVVRTKITILEVQKNLGQKWGVLWSGNYRAELAPTAKFPDSLDVEIQALESSGQARVLASPNLLCRSGSEAEFLAGGEFPIKISNFHQHDIVWKRFGVFLKVRPLVDSSQKIQLSLETEISQVTGLVENLPTMSTNKVSSLFDIANGKTVLLSGLIQSGSWNSNQGIMGLADIPILGTLFKSNDFQKKKTELVILVSPEIESGESTAVSTDQALGELQQLQIFQKVSP